MYIVHILIIYAYFIQVNRLTIDNNKLSQENARLLAALEKQKEELQIKSDLHLKKTEQFQAQWRKREEAEAVLKVIVYLLAVFRYHNFWWL